MRVGVGCSGVWVLVVRLGSWRGRALLDEGVFGGEGWRWGRGSWEDGYFSKVTQRASLWS